MTERKLLDDEGENRAVRSFLMVYGSPGITVGGMKRHMERCGAPYWPSWVEQQDPAMHLTKAGAQLWLRHLFSLETPAADLEKWLAEGETIHRGRDPATGEVLRVDPPTDSVAPMHQDLADTIAAIFAAVGYTEEYARQWPKEKASVTFKRWFDEQIAAAGVLAPLDKLSRCSMGCGPFGQCKAAMHGVPSECVGNAGVQEGFACPICGQPNAQHHPTCPRASGVRVDAPKCEWPACGCADAYCKAWPKDENAAGVQPSHNDQPKEQL
jgi:hypothetical protein